MTTVPVPIRVAVAEDQALVRSGFVALLRSDPELEVVGEAADGIDAIEVAKAARPQVMLMDIRMPRLDGVAATARLSADPGTADVKVLILTTFDADQYVHDALRAGASGFLLKDVLAADLLTAIKVIAAGEALLSPRITRRLIERYARQAQPDRQHVERVQRLTAARSSCSPPWPEGSPTSRSPPSSTSASPPRRPTSATSSRSSAPGTACS